MRFLILTDIHSNAKALQAVLFYTRDWKLNGIISLGDQVNYGPMPRETMAMLKDAKATLLMGNHEQRLERMRLGDRELCENYNWSMLQWTNAQIGKEALAYPHEMVLGNTLLTHAIPGDLNRLIRASDEDDIGAILDGMLKSRLVCGHNHAPFWQEKQGKQYICVGSLGMLEDNRGAHAAFALFDNGDVELYNIPYDTSGLKTAFKTSGLAMAAPEFSRVVHQTMLTGQQELALTFMKAVHAAAQSSRRPWHSKEAFSLAAQSFSWTEKLSCDAFWTRA